MINSKKIKTIYYILYRLHGYISHSVLWNASLAFWLLHTYTCKQIIALVYYSAVIYRRHKRHIKDRLSHVEFKMSLMLPLNNYNDYWLCLLFIFYFYTAFRVRTHTSPPPSFSVSPALHTQFHTSRVLFSLSHYGSLWWHQMRLISLRYFLSQARRGQFMLVQHNLQ